MADQEKSTEALRRLYGRNALYVDTLCGNIGTMHVTPERTNKILEIVLAEVKSNGQCADGHLKVTVKHTRGHFDPQSGLPPIFPAHMMLQAATLTMERMIRIYNQKKPNEHMQVRMRGFEKAEFEDILRPRTLVQIKTDSPYYGNGIYRANAVVLDARTGTPVAEITGLEVEEMVIPRKQGLLANQIIEFAAQSAASEMLTNHPNTGPLFTGIGRTRFIGDEVTLHSTLHATSIKQQIEMKRNFSCDSVVTDQKDNIVAQIEHMQALIAPIGIINRMFR